MEGNKDHDLLIEIKTKLDRVISDVAEVKTNSINRIESLENNKADKVEFDKIEKRVSWLEKIAYGALAIIGVVEFYYRFINK